MSTLSLTQPGLLSAIEGQRSAEGSAQAANLTRFEAILRGMMDSAALARLLQESGFADVRELLEGLLSSQPKAIEALQQAVATRMDVGGAELLSFVEEAQGRLQEGFREREAGLTDLFDRERTALGEGFETRQTELLGALEEDQAGIEQELRDRRSRVLEGIEGQGTQARGDIRRRFAAGSTQAQAQLARRGLSGTSLSPGVARGFQAEESRALAGLDERLRRERAGIDLSTSGDITSALERFAGQRLQAGASLSGAGLASRERLLGLEAPLQLSASGQRLGSEQAFDTRSAAIREALLSAGVGTQERLGLGAIGSEGDLTQALASIIAGQTGQSLALQQGSLSDIFRFLERREDLAPSRSSLSQLATGAGSFAAGRPRFASSTSFFV